MQTFWSRGYDAASVVDLCETMRINPASLYGAFGDKRSLYLAALQAYMLQSQKRFADAAALADGARGLRQFFANLIEWRTGDHGSWGCLMTNSAAEMAPRDPEVAQLVELHFSRLEGMFAALLASGVARGELRQGVGPDAAKVLVCLAQGLNVMAKTRPPRGQLQAIVDAGLSVILAPDA